MPEGERLRGLLGRIMRCLLLRCPACGRGRLFSVPFRVQRVCHSCGALFEREEGYFVGAISVNVLVTEAIILVVYLVSLSLVSFNEELIVAVLIPLAVVFPLAFYHHSWSIWVSFDHFFEELPKARNVSTNGKKPH